MRVCPAPISAAGRDRAGLERAVPWDVLMSDRRDSFEIAVDRFVRPCGGLHCDCRSAGHCHDCPECQAKGLHPTCHPR